VEIALREEGDFRRLYVIKRLRQGFREDPSVREMFLAEARIAGLIRHSNVVSVLDVGQDSKGPFLIMDYIEGVSVSHFIRDHKKMGREVPLQLALRIGAEAARGLHAAHTLCAPDGTPFHVVHRDVSPQNILLGFDGITRLTDFGVAKAVGHLVNTEAGVLKGKFGYMSPEQLRFQPVDARSDIFSLGVVLYELLAGRRLYSTEDGTPEPQRILEEPPPDIGEERSELPPEVVALFFRLLAKDPDLRPATAKEVAQTLDSLRVSMEAVQGVQSLGDYLETHCAERREKQLSAISVAMESLESQGGGPARPVIGAPPIAAGRQPAPAARGTPTRSLFARPLTWVIVVSVALISAVVLVAAFGMRLDRTEPDLRPTDSQSAAQAVPALPRVTAIPQDASVSDSAEPPSEAADASLDQSPRPSRQTKATRGGSRRGNRRTTKRAPSTSGQAPAKAPGGSRFNLWPMPQKTPD